MERIVKNAVASGHLPTPEEMIEDLLDWEFGKGTGPEAQPIPIEDRIPICRLSVVEKVQ